MPLVQKNVMLLVESCYVGDAARAKGLEFRFERRGQGDRAEDGEVIGGELDHSAAAADFDATEAKERGAAGEEGGSGTSEEHYFLRVGRDEGVGFSGHDVLW